MGFSSSRSHMPLSPTADTKHDRPRQQAVTNGNPTGSAVARDDDADDSPPGNSVVVRIGIPDLQQTVTHSQNGSGNRTTEMKPRTRHKPVCVSVCTCLFLCPPVCLPSLWLRLSQKCLRLDPELPVWTSKQRVLVTLTQSLSDVLNYGLFQPAFNGRAGKFLDEERLLKEYPLPPITPIPYLEVKEPTVLEGPV